MNDSLCEDWSQWVIFICIRDTKIVGSQRWMAQEDSWVGWLKKTNSVCVWEKERGRERKRMSVYTPTLIQNSNFPHVIIHTGSSLFLKNECTTSSRICFPPSLTINPLERIFVAQKITFPNKHAWFLHSTAPHTHTHQLPTLHRMWGQ